MLAEKLEQIRNFTQERGYKIYRKSVTPSIRLICKKQHWNMARRTAMLLKFMCETEDPIVFRDEKIAFVRTNINIPEYFNSKDIKKEFHKTKYQFFEPFNNACLDWSILLKNGLQGQLEAVRALQQNSSKSERNYLDSVVISLEAVMQLADRYRIAANAAGNDFVAETISKVPKYGAKSFAEALQSIRFVHSMLYLCGHAHMGLGRFDQYMYPYYKADIASGNLTKEDAKSLIKEFFISLNRDTDLYFGVQQGDNGQSLMLGGCKPEDGTSAVNELTYMVLEVSRDLKLIDPKINLRIDSSTPDDLLELGCELTKCGLGFPQYSNDEVVIPALIKKGYSLEDARDYIVAACWEFIIPGKACEKVNLGAINFPYAVDSAFEKTLKRWGDFSIDNFEQNIAKNVKLQLKNLITKQQIKLLPSPLATAFFPYALNHKKDISVDSKYNNIGIHGAGSANAADAIVAIKTIYKEQGQEGLLNLYSAIRANFVGFEKLHDYLQNKLPKVGNADAVADKELKFLFDTFANASDELSTTRRKIRAGSGSAMYYVLLTNSDCNILEPKVKATADGKKDGEPLSTSLAPSHGIKVNGVLSVLKSYSVIDYSRIMNGGPITIELSPSVFNSDEGVKKLAQLIKYFVKLGNQQLQLNLLDANVLEDAIAHPEKYRNLIVRVWGWSGYFTELAPEYQKQVLSRHKYNL